MQQIAVLAVGVPARIPSAIDPEPETDRILSEIDQIEPRNSGQPRQHRDEHGTVAADHGAAGCLSVVRGSIIGRRTGVERLWTDFRAIPCSRNAPQEAQEKGA